MPNLDIIYDVTTEVIWDERKTNKQVIYQTTSLPSFVIFDPFLLLVFRGIGRKSPSNRPPCILKLTLQMEECFQRECQGVTLSGKETKEVFIFLSKSVRSQLSSLCVRDEVFWTEDLTTKGLHDSYTILTLLNMTCLPN